MRDIPVIEPIMIATFWETITKGRIQLALRLGL